MPVQVRTQRARVVWDDFSGGELGSLSPDRAPKGTFTASEMLVNEQGWLIPRPGLYPALGPVISGWPAATTVAHVGTFSTGSVYVVDSAGHVRTVSLLGAVSAAYAGTAIDMPVGVLGQLACVDEAFPTLNQSLIGGTTGGSPCLFIVNHDTQTVTTSLIPSLSYAPQRIIRYQDRLVAADSQQTVAFSDPNSGVFPAANFFTVLGKGGISCLLDMHTFMLIGFAGGEWWALAGTPGTGTDSLRRLYAGPSQESGPVSFPVQPSGQVVNGQQAWFIPNSFDQGGAYPALFSGQSVRDFRHLGSLDITAGPTVTPLAKPNEVVFLGGHTNTANRAYVRKNGVWTAHNLKNPGGTLSPHACRYMGGLLIVDNAATPAFWVWDPSAAETPQDASSGQVPLKDGATAFVPSVTFPNVWAPDDQLWALRQVAVDLTPYDVTGYDPAITLHVDVIGRHDAAETAYTNQTWTVSGASVTTANDYRHVFAPGAAVFGGGCRITLTGIRSVAIRRVTATFDIRGENA